MHPSGGSANSLGDFSRAQSGRQRGGQLRPSRPRAQNEGRTQQPRFYGSSNRRYSGSAPWRDPPTALSTGELQNIDINDSSQWPSIQESSSASRSKSRNSAVTAPVDQSVGGREPARSVQPAEKGEFQTTGEQVPCPVDGQSRDGSIHRRQSAPYRGQHGMYYSHNPQNYQPASRNYNRGYGERPQQNSMGGVRATRGHKYYSGSNVSANFSHNSMFRTRFGRGYMQQMPPTMMMRTDAAYIPQNNYDEESVTAATQFPADTTVTAVSQSPQKDETKPSDDLTPLQQVEYYFSAKNLETDHYIRSLMDEEGWVDIGQVHRFRRIRRLELPYQAFVDCLVPSQQLDVDVASHKVRTKHDPKKWVLAPGSSNYPPPHVIGIPVAGSNAGGYGVYPSAYPLAPPSMQFGMSSFMVNPVSGFVTSGVRPRYYPPVFYGGPGSYMPWPYGDGVYHDMTQPYYGQDYTGAYGMTYYGYPPNMQVQGQRRNAGVEVGDEFPADMVAAGHLEENGNDGRGGEGVQAERTAVAATVAAGTSEQQQKIVGVVSELAEGIEKLGVSQSPVCSC